MLVSESCQRGSKPVKPNSNETNRSRDIQSRRAVVAVRDFRSKARPPGPDARGPGRKSNRVTTYSPGRARGAHPGNGEWTGAVAGAAPMVMRGVIVMAGVNTRSIG